MNKLLVYNSVVKELDYRISQLKTAIQNQKESLNSSSESTAGNKHNTTRAMIHIELDKLHKQLLQNSRLKNLIQNITPENKTSIIKLGSLIKTNKGYIYIAIPLGKIQVDNQEVMVISLASPIGKALCNKKDHDSIIINNHSIIIKKVS